MKYFITLLFLVIGSIAADDVGDYIPKAFFTIDQHGNVNPARPINAKLLSRARRQIQPFGQPSFPFQPFPTFTVQPGQSQGSFVSSSQTLSSRFGEDEPVVSGQTTVFHSNGGKYQQTSTYLRPDGSVSTNKQSGRVKRQQSQSQKQNGTGGNQSQVQSQNQPGGQQIQSQTQGQNPENPGVTDNRNNSPNNIPQGNQPNYPQNNNPQGNQQNFPQNNPQGNQNFHPQNEYAQSDNRNNPQSNYNNPQFGFGAPFGLGGFGPGFIQQPGFVQPGFGFANPFGFPQPGFVSPVNPAFAPGPGIQTSQVTGSTQTLDNRFGEEEPVITGGTQTITSQNGNYHITSTVLKPDGQTITNQQSGKYP